MNNTDEGFELLDNAIDDTHVALNATSCVQVSHYWDLISKHFSQYSSVAYINE